MKKNIRYLYLMLGTVILLFAGLIYAWSIFKGPLKAQFPMLTGENLSFTFTVSMIFFCIGSILSGYFSAKIAFKIRLVFSAILLGVGFFLISQIDADNPGNIALKLYLFYGVLCGTGVGIAYNAILGSVLRWFPDSVGFASGVLLMGFGFGSLILGGLASRLALSMGIMSTFFILAVAIPICMILCILALKEPEEALMAAKSTSKAGRAEAVFTPSEMLRNKFFWLFTFWTILISSSGLMIINNAAGIMESFGAPAIAGLFMSVFNGLGRVFIGSTYDKLGDKKTTYLNAAILLMAGILMFIGAKLNMFLPVLLGLLACGTSYGGAPSLASAIIKEGYGAKHYPMNFSIANAQLIISATLGPTISNFLINSSGGSFGTSFLTIILFSAIALILTAIMYRFQPQ
ncbi:MAG: MFS transporter [Tissierellia bacterium]|nr:MFS transporter [Tissierellia bacterium]